MGCLDPQASRKCRLNYEAPDLPTCISISLVGLRSADDVIAVISDVTRRDGAVFV